MLSFELAYKAKSFPIFESVSYTNRPNSIGFKRATILYEDMLWRNGEPKTGPPNTDSLNYWVNLIRTLNYNGPLILDIEHWPIYTDPTTRQYMVDILNAFKVPNRLYQVGYYAMIPQRNHIEALSPGSSGYLAWQQRNTFVKPIADAEEILFPSLYTLYPDQIRWDQYTLENIKEARRIAPTKKLYCVLWPQYHQVTPGGIGLTYIDPEFWWHQLMTVFRLCDGLIIWRINDGQTWREDYPWYLVTKEFAKRYGIQ